MDSNTKIEFLEKELAEHKKLINQFKNLLDSIPDPVFMKDENLLWIYGNPIILSLYNIDQNNYIGKAEDELLPEEFATSCMQSDINAKNSKVVNKSEERSRDSDGKIHYYEVFKVPFYDNNDEFKGLIGVGRDITATKEATQKLQDALEAQKLLNQQIKLVQMGEMMENIAHQWRQPLSVINSIASSFLLQQELGILDENTSQSNFEDIVHQVAYMNQTINDFRDFLGENKEKDNFNISHMIEQSLNIVKGHMKRYNITITNNAAEKQLHYFGLKSELMQVVINIINNAKDAMVENNIDNKYIIIDIIENKSSIDITIEDNGGGIPIDIISNIFDPHFTTKKDIGTGIGLYMSKQIIYRSFHGDIEAYNTAEGAKFIIRLPNSNLS